MITLGKIEAMRKQTGATFAEAKAALLETDGDLSAAISLYQQRKKDAGGARQDTPWEENPRQRKKARREEEPRQKRTNREHTGQEEQTREGQTKGQWNTQWERRTPPPDMPPVWEGEASGVLSGLFALLGRLFQWSAATRFSVYRQGRLVFSLPFLVCLVVLLVSFWALPFAFIVGLFMGYSYRIERG
jgi:hypothetical protein